MSGVLHDASGHFVRCGEELVLPHDAADHAPFQGRMCVDLVAGEGHFGSPLITHRTGQEPGATVTGNEAQLHETLGEERTLGRDTDVAHHGQITVSYTHLR